MHESEEIRWQRSKYNILLSKEWNGNLALELTGGTNQ
jgi:hypothetical protein